MDPFQAKARHQKAGRLIRTPLYTRLCRYYSGKTGVGRASLTMYRNKINQGQHGHLMTRSVTRYHVLAAPKSPLFGLFQTCCPRCRTELNGKMYVQLVMDSISLSSAWPSGSLLAVSRHPSESFRTSGSSMKPDTSSISAHNHRTMRRVQHVPNIEI